MENNLYCVIMAGGIGSRFWPLSRSKKPKQFIDILGTGQTLIQQTYNRIRKVIPSENFLVVTSEKYEELVLKQLPEITPEQVLLEPMRRNTAPCIAYANYKILEMNPDANILVAPSDHIILNENEFVEVIKKGFEFVGKNDCLLTLGIQPSRPETGYGYIQISGEKNNIELNSSFREVKTFTEKPDLKMAELFLESGDFFWNSGMFFWSLKTIINSFKEHLPEIDTIFADGIGKYNTIDEQNFISEAYPSCRNISIDYGIMEKAENVYVLCSNFGWSDLGSWGSLYEHLPKNKNKNTISGKNVYIYESNNCLINVPDDKLLVIHGLDDFIVVESENILLICKKQEEQKIKQFVNDIKFEKGDEHV